ncbi:type II toxin-antitoxin system HicA family toxin [Olsenella profusa]
MGCKGGRGSHRRLEKGRRVLIVPYHRRELARATSERINRDAGWSEP